MALFLLAWVLLQRPAVQQWAVDKITTDLSRTWGAKVAIDKVNIRFFKTLALEGIYLEDLSQDTLLDAAEKVGLELPHSCRAGMCASCMCEVKQGKVQLLANDVLSERDLSQSLTLSCQAVPLTDKVHIRYT
jgi:3-ketosteroid 9alpha-monooxygenase subunit B